MHFYMLISYYYYHYILTKSMPKKKILIRHTYYMVIIGEKYLQIEISRLIMIAHTHVRARAHPIESHDSFN